VTAMRSLGLDVAAIRRDFPIFAERGSSFYYLDSAASAQRPSVVLEAMDAYYRAHHANVHRGVYALAEDATERYEAARRRVGEFVAAPDPSREVVFVKNATEGLNLVAQGLGRVLLGPGRAVVLTEMEHHANLVPWMILQEQLGFELRYLPFDEEGILVLDEAERILDGARIVSVTAMSNVLGTINPIRRIADLAHDAGAVLVVDAAQYAPHHPIDVTAWGADLVAMTGHKMLGPTGIGALWGRLELLERMTPFLGGGDMILDVTLEGFVPNEVPYKFEAGTPPIAEAIGWEVAIDYLANRVGFEALEAHERALTAYALEALREGLGSKLRIFGPPDAGRRGGVISFELEGVHPHDVAQVLDRHGVCVRAGHHCAKPLMREIGQAATARASLYLYNDTDDIDALVRALQDAWSLFNA